MHGVGGAKPDMTVEKQSRIREAVNKFNKQPYSGFLNRVVTSVWCFLFVRPSAFWSFCLPLWGSHLSSLIVKTPAFQWLSCTLAKL